VYNADGVLAAVFRQRIQSFTLLEVTAGCFGGFE